MVTTQQVTARPGVAGVALTGKVFLRCAIRTRQLTLTTHPVVAALTRRVNSCRQQPPYFIAYFDDYFNHMEEKKKKKEKKKEKKKGTHTFKNMKQTNKTTLKRLAIVSNFIRTKFKFCDFNVPTGHLSYTFTCNILLRK